MDPRAARPTTVDPRTSLALWLRAARAQRQLTLDDVARVTKIQARILEKLETGAFEGLPAEVFVRGFVKSFARAVGLDESEASERYSSCAALGPTAAIPAARAFVETLVAAPPRERKQTAAPAPEVIAAPATPAEEIAAPIATPVEPIVAAVPLAECAPAVDAAGEAPEAKPKAKRTRKKSTSTTPRTRKKKAPAGDVLATTSTIDANAAAPTADVGTTAPIEVPNDVARESRPDLSAGAIEIEAKVASDAVVTTSDELGLAQGSVAISRGSDASSVAELDAISLAQGSEPVATTSPDVTSGDAAISATGDATHDTTDTTSSFAASDAFATIAADSPVAGETHSTWQPQMPPPVTTPTLPWRRPTYATYVAPTLVIDDADPESAERERADREAEASGKGRVSFLPPILLDREDKSARQGGLTLAVIILLIAATLTLSYLMRRPSATGDGVTMTNDVVTTQIVA